MNYITDVDNRFLKLSLLDFVVTDFIGFEGISELSSYTILAFSDNDDIDVANILNEKITLKICNKDNDLRYFNGIITEFNELGDFILNDNTYTKYQIVFKAHLSISDAKVDHKIYQNKSIVEIVDEVLTKYDLKYEFKTKENRIQHDYIVQQNESDFDFIARLLSFEGVFYYSIQQSEFEQIVFADSITEYKPYPKVINLKEYDAREYQITSWQSNWQAIAGKISFSDYNFEQPTSYKSSLLKTKDVALEHNLPKELSNYSKFQYPGYYDNLEQAENIIKWRSEEHLLNYNSYLGDSNIIDMSPALSFTLKSTEKYNHETHVVVQKVCHIAYDNTILNNNQNSIYYKNNITCLPKESTYRPKQKTLIPSIGVQLAKVAGPENYEIFTDKHRRIKAQFHWDQYGEHNENSSCMMRVAQNWAGNNYGVTFTPRITDEIAVHFIDGDPNRPFVISSIYNENNPPYDHKHTVNINGIKTKIIKKPESSNELHFNDKHNHQQIYLKAQRNLQENIKNNAITHIKNNTTENIQNNSITIQEGDNTTTLETGNQTSKVAKKIHVKANLITTQTEGSQIELSANGITIQSSTIKIN